MTEVDELLARLRNLEPVALEREFSRSVQQQGRRRLTARARKTPFASLLTLGAVAAYLGWAVHFASALYR